MNTEERMEQIFDTYEKKLEGGLKACDLGSCQYMTAQYTAEWALDLLKLIKPEGFERLLGITYERKITDIVEFEGMLKDDIQETLGELTEFLRGDGYVSVKEMIADRYPEYLDDFTDGRLSVEAYMTIAREGSWDLWSAMVTPLIDMKIKDHVQLPTFGPVLNQMAQSDNFTVGIAIAYVLYMWGDYGITMETFAGFDT